VDGGREGWREGWRGGGRVKGGGGGGSEGVGWRGEEREEREWKTRLNFFR
jgi:hypothetical protein